MKQTTSSSFGVSSFKISFQRSQRKLCIFCGKALTAKHTKNIAESAKKRIMS